VKSCCSHFYGFIYIWFVIVATVTVAYLFANVTSQLVGRGGEKEVSGEVMGVTDKSKFVDYCFLHTSNTINN